MQADNIHPSARGVGLVVDALGPKVLELLERVKPAP
jgi:acyl-CoA thioesterase-1